MNDYNPKCSDLMEAIAEVRFWIGVNMIRFTYKQDELRKLMKACLDFTKSAKDE